MLLIFIFSTSCANNPDDSTTNEINSAKESSSWADITPDPPKKDVKHKKPTRRHGKTIIPCYKRFVKPSKKPHSEPTGPISVQNHAVIKKVQLIPDLLIASSTTSIRECTPTLEQTLTEASNNSSNLKYGLQSNAEGDYIVSQGSLPSDQHENHNPSRLYIYQMVSKRNIFNPSATPKKTSHCDFCYIPEPNPDISTKEECTNACTCDVCNPAIQRACKCEMFCKGKYMPDACFFVMGSEQQTRLRYLEEAFKLFSDKEKFALALAVHWCIKIKNPTTYAYRNKYCMENKLYIVNDFYDMQLNMYIFAGKHAGCNDARKTLDIYKTLDCSITGSKLAEVLSFIHFHELISAIERPYILEQKCIKKIAVCEECEIKHFKHTSASRHRKIDEIYSKYRDEAWKGHDMINLLEKLKRILVEYCQPKKMHV